MRIQSLLAAIAIGAVSIITPAHAALVVTETTDFANDRPASPVGALMAGVNSISGSLSGDCPLRPTGGSNCGVGDTEDLFQVELADALEITDITLRISNLSAPAGFQLLTVSSFESGSLLSFPFFSGIEGDFPLAFRTPGPTVDTSSIVFQVLTSGASGTGAFAFDWQVDFTVANTDVSAVPLPGALGFMLAGLGGLSVLRRRAAA